jgi:hypothetical protein
METDMIIRKQSILVRKRKFGLFAKSTASFDFLKLDRITEMVADLAAVADVATILEW